MKILIVEDEIPAAERLEKMLKVIDETTEIVGSTDSIETTLEWFDSNPLPDLILMDIHLADGNCFDIFNFKKIDCPIIFTTAYDEYAMQAFKVNAIDYLLKPLKKNELEAAFAKYTSLFGFQKTYDYTHMATTMTPQYVERFLIKTGQSFRVVDIKDAVYFITENKITFLVQPDGKRYLIDFSMEKLEQSLNPKTYFRVNRQFIISIPAIHELHAHSKSRVKINLKPAAKEECIVSSEKSADFKKWLTGE
jgi:DNA-binding LytR/AlgR family response regulator